MEQPGLHGRHRNKDGEISRKHGNTLVGTLRRVYGARFAKGFPSDARLEDVLADLDEKSLGELVHDHENGHLDGEIASA